MFRETQNIPRLLVVDHALGPLRERVILVGGVEVNTYSTAPTGTPDNAFTAAPLKSISTAPHRAHWYARQSALLASQ